MDSEAMPILREMILYHQSRRFPKLLTFDDSDPTIQSLLLQINRKQRDRWKKEEIVPVQVLEVFWHWNIRFNDTPPTHGLKLDYLLENLWKFYLNCSSDKDRATADFIYKDIVKNEKEFLNYNRTDNIIYCFSKDVPSFFRKGRRKEIKRRRKKRR